MTESFEHELERLLIGVPASTKEKIIDALPQRLAETVREVAAEVLAEEPNPLREAYEGELSRVRRGDVKAVTDLKVKYRKKGLNV